MEKLEIDDFGQKSFEKYIFINIYKLKYCLQL